MSTNNNYDRRAVFSWSMYDFANSSYHALVLTFVFSTFFTTQIASDKIIGTALWSRGITLSALIVAILSPFMGAFADAGGYRKRILKYLTIAAAIGTAGLYTVLPGEVLKGLVLFVGTNIAMELAVVFYNAFLPDIAPPEKIGRISGFGWAFGYVGGLSAMLIAMVGLVQPETPWFGFSRELGENIRATNLLVAVWFLLFSLPLFLFVKEKSTKKMRGLGKLFATTSGQLVATFREIKQYRQIVKLLFARLFYNDGLITIFAFGGIYAAGTFGFEFEEILFLGIVLNITAGLGAFVFGFVDDILGGKKTIQITIIGFIFSTIIAVLAPNKTMFWISAIITGLFSGPNQAASRSLMARFVPMDKENEFFGFFAFSGKATAFLGPLLLGVLTELFNSQRAGIAVVIILFILGGLILRTVNEEEGMKVRLESAES